MTATELGRGILPQSPAVEILTVLPPNMVQNDPSPSETMSSSPSPEPPQQSNQSTHARQVDLLKTRVVVVAEVKLIDSVPPPGTTICRPAAEQLRLSTVRIATGRPPVLVKLTEVTPSDIGPVGERLVKSSDNPDAPRMPLLWGKAAATP